MHREAREETSFGYEGWRVVAAAGIAVFFASVPFFTFAVLLRPLLTEFGWSREGVASAFAAMTLSAALTAPISGHFFDRLGPRLISGPCLIVCASAFASLSMLTPNLAHLYAVFALIGLAATGTSVVVFSRVVSSWFDRRRGVALGIVISASAFGAVVHPTVTQAIIRQVGWRRTCLLLGAAMLAVGVPTIFRFVRERAVSAPDRGSRAAGVPVRDAVRTRRFWTLVIVVFGSTVAMNGAIVHLAALLTDRGIPATQAAMAVSAMGAASLAGRLLTGALLDRFAAARVSFVLLLIAASGTFLLAGAHSLSLGLLAAVLIGFGTGGELDTIPYLLSRYFGLASLSTLFGFNFTAWGLAGAVGPIVMGRAFDSTGSYTGVLILFGMGTLAVAGLMLSLPPYAASRPHDAPAVATGGAAPASGS